MPGDALPAMLAAIGRVEPVGRAFPVFKLGPIDVALPRRESKAGRGHTAFHVQGDPHDVVRGGRPAARLHHQRHRLGSAHRRLPRSLPRPRRSRPPVGCASSTRARSPTTACACCARCSSPRASSAGSTTRRARSAGPSPSTICRPSGCGASSRSCCSSPSGPSIGFALARELGVVEQILPEMTPLYDCPQDPEWHPEGDVWTHTLLVIDEARRRNADLDRPRLATVMLGAVCHDLGQAGDHRGHRRPLAITRAMKPRASSRPRGSSIASTSTPSTASTCGARCSASSPSTCGRARSTRRRTRLRDGAFRRLAARVDLELLVALRAAPTVTAAPAAFDCSAMDWFLERARALGVRTRAAHADPAGTPSARPGRHAWPAHGRDPARRLRTSARRRGHHAGGAIAIAASDDGRAPEPWRRDSAASPEPSRRLPSPEPLALAAEPAMYLRELLRLHVAAAHHRHHRAHAARPGPASPPRSSPRRSAPPRAGRCDRASATAVGNGRRRARPRARRRTAARARR